MAESFETDALQAAHRLARRPVHRRWGRGRRARPPCCWPTRPATTAARPARRSSPAAARARWPTALAAAAREAGVEIRTGAEVAAITSRDGRATGVVLAGGEELTARAVVAGIDPKRTLTGLADPVAIGPSLLWRAGNIRTPGTVAKVNLVLSGLPALPGRAATTRGCSAAGSSIAPGIDAMERAHDAAKYGRCSDAPIMEATIPSLADPVAGRGRGARARTS